MLLTPSGSPVVSYLSCLHRRTDDRAKILLALAFPPHTHTLRQQRSTQITVQQLGTGTTDHRPARRLSRIAYGCCVPVQRTKHGPAQNNRKRTQPPPLGC